MKQPTTQPSSRDYINCKIQRQFFSHKKSKKGVNLWHKNADNVVKTNDLAKRVKVNMQLRINMFHKFQVNKIDRR